MRLQMLLLVIVLAGVTACVPKQGELHTIKALCISNPCAAVGSTTAKSSSGCATQGADRDRQISGFGKQSQATGLWFLRKVKRPGESLSSWTTKVLEVIWCPEDRADFSRCRTSIVSHKKYLQQFDRAERLKPAASPTGMSGQDETKGLELPAWSSGTAANDDQNKRASNMMSTSGKDLNELGAARIAKLWKWNGRRVIIFSRSGSREQGMLLSVNEAGIEIEGRKSLIKWSKVSSIELVP